MYAIRSYYVQEWNGNGSEHQSKDQNVCREKCSGLQGKDPGKSILSYNFV